jgi:hypothetical protein
MKMVKETLHRAAPGPANHGAAQRSVLLGVKRQDWRSQSKMARGLGRKLAERGEIAYWVVAPEDRSPADQRANQRAQARARTRLRSAKLLGAGCRFLCEGRICDQSRDGLRLALARDVALPPQLAVHVDETSEVREAEVVWRRGSTIGVRLQGPLPADAMTAAQRYALRERYYAIPA